MIVTKVSLQNWRNFRKAETKLSDLNFILGPNAAGKSNFLDVFRFIKEVAKSSGGGLQKAVDSRGKLKKLRCLHARQITDVGITIELSEDADSQFPNWRYELFFNSEGSGKHRVIVKKEIVTHIDKNGREKIILKRPSKEDEADPLRLTQTALEQIQANEKFREIADFFDGVAYLHIVPQLLKFAEKIGGIHLEDDPFGQGFLEKIAGTPEKTRKSRLGRIEKALKKVISQVEQLEFVRDEINGTPHLQIKYKHHRPNGAIQREDQFSDGTLRLISLFWLLLDGSSLLMLEEPELSLNEEIVRELPPIIDKLQRSSKKKKRQILVTTHSQEMLDNPGIDSTGIVVLTPTEDGTILTGPTPEELEALDSGFTAADAILPRARGKLDLQSEMAL